VRAGRPNIITAVEIAGRDAQDAPLLPALIDTTARNFTIREVSADKAIRQACRITTSSTPYEPTAYIRSRPSTGKAGVYGSRRSTISICIGPSFSLTIIKRSNVETAVHLIKSKFRDHVRSKTETAMHNEVLYKNPRHNICCLIRSVYDLESIRVPDPERAA